MSFKMDAEVNTDEIKALEKELTESIDKVIYDVADQIMAISQNLVPVDKGTLKKSGNVVYGRGYAYVGYNTPYAETVHDGYGSHQRQVRAHTRRVKTSGIVISVRSHTRQMKARTGKPYMDDAISAVLKRLPEEIRNQIEITRVERDY